MDYRKDCVTSRIVKDDAVFYNVRWSDYKRVNRHQIARSVPSRAGIFELYYEDDQGKTRLFHVERVWYGGLRSEIRRASDPLTVENGHRRVILQRNRCWYRYTIVESKPDLLDILHFFSVQLLPESEPPGHSGRFNSILVTEEPERKPFRPEHG